MVNISKTIRMHFDDEAWKLTEEYDKLKERIEIINKQRQQMDTFQTIST